MVRICPHCRTEYGPDQKICPNDGARLGEDEAQPDALIGQVLAERYRVIRTLGEGGMGRVYLAEHVRMGRLSAIKVMSPALVPTADAIGRFNREAANASRINHPNVAAIYDFGETNDGTLYLAMEYVEGETLAHLLKREGPMAFARVGDLTRQIADALHAAHQLGIVHRDLKPDNILLARDSDGVERIKVVDFGIAKAASGGGQTVTDAGVSIGTPEYMSPEQLAGSQLDYRSDIYSLGLVVFAMLTNESPFPELTSKDSLIQRLTERPRPLADAAPGMNWPPKLQGALDRALSPEAHDRYRRVNDFALDVATSVGSSAAPMQPRTRPMTPLGVPGITQPLGSVKSGGERVSARRRKTTTIGAGVLFAAAIFSLGIWKYSTSSNAGSSDATASDAGRRKDSVNAVRDTSVPASNTRATAAVDTAPRVKIDTSTAPKPIAVAPKAVVGPTNSKLVTKPLAADRGTPQPAKPETDSAAPSAMPNNMANMMGRVGRRAGAHGYLRENGDSVVQPRRKATVESADAAEILGHLSRAKRMINGNQPIRGFPELRTAYEEYLFYANEHPGTRETQNIGRQFRALINHALEGCATADSMTVQGGPTMSCMALRSAAAMMPLP